MIHSLKQSLLLLKLVIPSLLVRVYASYNWPNPPNEDRHSQQLKDTTCYSRAIATRGVVVGWNEGADSRQENVHNQDCNANVVWYIRDRSIAARLSIRRFRSEIWVCYLNWVSFSIVMRVDLRSADSLCLWLCICGQPCSSANVVLRQTENLVASLELEAGVPRNLDFLWL